jgi:hypothetical protein
MRGMSRPNLQRNIEAQLKQSEQSMRELENQRHHDLAEQKAHDKQLRILAYDKRRLQRRAARGSPSAVENISNSHDGKDRSAISSASPAAGSVVRSDGWLSDDLPFELIGHFEDQQNPVIIPSAPGHSWVEPMAVSLIPHLPSAFYDVFFEVRTHVTAMQTLSERELDVARASSPAAYKKDAISMERLGTSMHVYFELRARIHDTAILYENLKSRMQVEFPKAYLVAFGPAFLLTPTTPPPEETSPVMDAALFRQKLVQKPPTASLPSVSPAIAELIDEYKSQPLNSEYRNSTGLDRMFPVCPSPIFWLDACTPCATLVHHERQLSDLALDRLAILHRDAHQARLMAQAPIIQAMQVGAKHGCVLDILRQRLSVALEKETSISLVVLEHLTS